MKRQNGFTLVEVLIVVLIMAVLAATVIPQFQTSSREAEAATAEFNLQTMRAQISLYKSQHAGTAPAALADLTTYTDEDGNSVTAGANGAVGPYLVEVPYSPLTGNAGVKNTTNTSTYDASGSAWLYNSTTGDLQINHTDYVGVPAP